MQKLLILLTAVLVLAAFAAFAAPPAQAVPTSRIACSGGSAAGYPCRNVDLLAQLSLAELGASNAAIKANKHWGWTDPLTGRDYVLFGLTNATSFVDITDRENPVYLGQLPSHQGVSQYRDMVVSGNTLFVVADTPAQHGLQVFDLTQLRNVPNPPVTFAETAHYAGFVAGHSLWMNEATGFLYVFRSVGDACQNGVHVVNVQNPLQPTFAGCFGQTDTPLSTGECLVYDGPDHDYHGHEICFVGSDDNVSIFDVTDKSQPVQVADFTYPGIARAHQGDLTADLQLLAVGGYDGRTPQRRRTPAPSLLTSATWTTPSCWAISAMARRPSTTTCRSFGTGCTKPTGGPAYASWIPAVCPVLSFRS